MEGMWRRGFCRCSLLLNRCSATSLKRERRDADVFRQAVIELKTGRTIPAPEEYTFTEMTAKQQSTQNRTRKHHLLVGSCESDIVRRSYCHSREDASTRNVFEDTVVSKDARCLYQERVRRRSSEQGREVKLHFLFPVADFCS